MINGKLKFLKPTPRLRRILILTSLEENPSISQRKLAKLVGMSATMTNDYVAVMKREGLVEVDGKTNRSMRYRLTHQGREVRAEMVLESSREITQFYGMVKSDFARRLLSLYNEGMKRVVFYGAAETGELAYNASRNLPMEVIGIADSDGAKHGRKFGELHVLPPGVIESLSPDAVIVTSYGYRDEIYERIRTLEEKGIRVRKL